MQSEFTERRQCINCKGAQLTKLSRGRYTDEPLLGFINGDPWGTNPLPYLADAEWVFVQCQDCSQLFHQRILTAQWNEKRFSEWMSATAIEEFEKRIGNAAQRHFDKGRQHVEHALRIEKLTRSIRGKDEVVRVLDFGCGWGDFLVTCQQFGFDMSGVDRSAARRGGSRLPIYAELLEVRDRKPFHAITLFEVLEHLDSPADTLSMLMPYLAPGGVVILETPDCSGVNDIRTIKDYRAIHPLEHINAFTPETLRSIGERSGLRCIPRGVAHVTADIVRVIKTSTKHAVWRDGLSTRLYFLKS